MLIKVTYIISDIDKALAFEWIAAYLDRTQFELSFILLNPGDSVLEQWLREQQLPVRRINCSGKKNWPAAWWRLYRLLKQQKPDIVHCHLLQATLLGLSAAKAAGIRSRIYTRHHSSQHHVYHAKGVFWDKMANRLATKIVAISGVVKQILLDWEKADPAKIVLIPHGFLLAEFEQVSTERVAAFRQRHKIEATQYVIGVISRFIELKGVQYIIPAFAAYYREHPEAVLLLMNPKGDYEATILALLQQLPENAYRLIPFEPDVAAAYHSMSVFIHAPIDHHSEAFGQTYIEALAAGVPSIFTLSGIAPDFIRDRQHALVVPFKDEQAICKAITTIESDQILRAHLKEQGRLIIRERFSLNRMIEQLEALYKDSVPTV